MKRIQGIREISKGSYKGTRIQIGNDLLNFKHQIAYHDLANNDYNYVHVPIIQSYSTFEDKVGQENNNLMFRFKDRGNRDLCLAPEYTAVLQKLATTEFKNEKDVKLFYIAECFRGEKPQRGRYRQFTQVGVEILNPTNVERSLNEVKAVMEGIIDSATYMFSLKPEGVEYKINDSVKRGLDYYKDGLGFEIHMSSLGTASQICGGGVYENGVGAAMGLDRLIKAYDEKV